jgi:hypothetical protein
MRKFLTSGLAAVIAVGAVLATAGPASAERRYYGGHHHYGHHGGDGDEVAAAIIGGVAGLALGAALSGSSQNRSGYGYYDRGYDTGYRYDPRYDSYSRGYYGPPPGYRTCVTRDRVWDPYIGHHVTIERSYRC